jgi:hypothetical protein
MRYRKHDPQGDYSFGHGLGDFLIDSPETVALAVQTRLLLWLGEWFLDTRDGTDWNNSVLGKYTAATRDAVIRARILDTPGVNRILTYGSTFDGNTRQFNVTAAIDTIYGVVPDWQLSLPTAK